MASSVFSEVPALLNGIWEGSDRYVFFTDQINEKGKNISYLTILLKTFYGWYIDRAAEPSTYEKEIRTVNDTTAENALHIKIEFIPITKNNSADSGAWDLKIKYSKHEVTYIPVAVLNKKLYLNFFINKKNVNPVGNNLTSIDFLDKGKKAENQDSPKTYFNGIKGLQTGFWQGICNDSGIRVSQSYKKYEITSYYITKDIIYKIRYWQTDMPFSSDNANVVDKENSYTVPKHILSSGKIFTCVPGQGHIIRNVDKLSTIPNVFISSDGMILINNSSYLSLKITPGSLKEYINIVTTQNAKKKPSASPPFSPSNLDWHLKEIYYLEKNNKLIQIVRKHQKAFAQQHQN